MDYFMKKISRFARNDNTHHGVEDRECGGGTATPYALPLRRRTLVWKSNVVIPSEARNLYFRNF
jgi:hypothetical protein